MPSRKNKPLAHSSSTRIDSGLSIARHAAFLPLLALTFVLWMVYRYSFSFPVWFDETIGKAIFFGLPVWAYIMFTRSKSLANTYAPSRMRAGLLLGLAIGGTLGFAATVASLIQRQAFVQTAPLFASSTFWWEFFLAMMTAFWESLFFFTWVMTVIMERYRKWEFVPQVALTVGIFLLFHLPNAFLRFPLQVAIGQAILLLFFAVGQALLFARTKNLYAVILSHAIWGMVLLVHSR